MNRMPLKKNATTESVWEPQLLCTGEREALFSPDLGAPAIPSSLSATLARLRTKARRPVNSLPHKGQVSLMHFGEQTASGQKELLRTVLAVTHFLSPVGPSVTRQGGAGPGCRRAEAGQLRPVSGDRLRTESGS